VFGGQLATRYPALQTANIATLMTRYLD